MCLISWQSAQKNDPHKPLFGRNCGSKRGSQTGQVCCLLLFSSPYLKSDNGPLMREYRPLRPWCWLAFQCCQWWLSTIDWIISSDSSTRSHNLFAGSSRSLSLYLSLSWGSCRLFRNRDHLSLNGQNRCKQDRWTICHKLSYIATKYFITSYDDLWRFMTFYVERTKATELVIKCRTLS